MPYHAKLQNIEPESGSWPNERDQLLLDACLGDDEKARQAFLSWRQEADIDHLPQDNYRLLPLLGKALDRIGEPDPKLGVLRGTLRLAWARNQVYFSHLKSIVHKLAESGVEVMLLKGAVLVVGGYYPSLGLRPMADFDLLIKLEDLPVVMEILAQEGYEPGAGETTAGSPLEKIRACRRHSFPMESKDDTHPEIDLHRTLMAEDSFNRPDSAIWSRAERQPFQGIIYTIPDPTHLLLHTCAHGLVWNEVKPLRWIPDAIMILQHRRDDVDWDLLVRLAVRTRVVQRIQKALEYLHGTMGADIPAETLSKLAKARKSIIELVEARFVYRPQGILGEVPRRLCRILRAYRAGYPSIGEGLRDFPLHSNTLLGIEDGQSIVGAILGKMGRFVARAAKVPFKRQPSGTTEA